MTSDPVMEVDVLQTYYSNGTIATRHVIRYNPEPHEPLWYTGEKLLPTGWYYWDETWGSCYGPFEDEDDCRDSLAVYCESIK